MRNPKRERFRFRSFTAQLADGHAVMTFNARQLLHIEPLGEKQARGGAALAR